MSAKMLSLDKFKSANDMKNYAVIELPKSGLEVLMVSTKLFAEKRGETTPQAAASLCVNVGSFADPIAAQGLAHFLEHMIFMGSEKYPEENYYESLVQNHGGSCNAYTEFEYTNYEFDVQSQHFAAVLDIFANCFYQPRFARSAVDREIKAIESEFRLACQVIRYVLTLYHAPHSSNTTFQSDSSRIQQCQCSTSTKGHILTKFSWGSLESLRTEPARQHTDVHRLLRQFHASYYRPSGMKLVVLAPVSLSDLHKHVMTSFGHWGTRFPTTSPLPELPTRHLALRTTNFPFDKTVLGIVTRILPLKRRHKLILTWQIPSQLRKYRSKVADYLSHLIGHEGPGSLLSELKRLQYATAVNAGIGRDGVNNNTMFSLFEVAITLSSYGMANWMYATQTVFQYVSMLRAAGPQHWIFKELAAMAEVEYAHLEEVEENDWCEEFSVYMQDSLGIDRRDLLPSQHRFWDWDADAITATLECFRPSNTRVDLVSSAFAQGVKGAGVNGDKDSDDSSEDDNGDSEDDNGDSDSDDDDDSDSNDDESDAGDEDPSKNDSSVPSPEQLRSMYQGPKEWLPLVVPPASRPLDAFDTVPNVCVPCDPIFSPKNMEWTPRPPQEEKFFKTLHWRDPIPVGMLQLWQKDFDPDTSKMHLPPRNPFIPANLSLVPPNAKTNALKKGEETAPSDTATSVAATSSSPCTNELTAVPQCVEEQDGFRLWHFNDTVRFPVPKVEIFLKLSSGLTPMSPKAWVLTALLARAVEDALMEVIYLASMAGLHCRVYVCDTGISVRVQGFSDKAPVLLTRVLELLFAPNRKTTSDKSRSKPKPSSAGEPTTASVELFSERLFTRCCEQLSKSLSNTSFNAADAAADARRRALNPLRHAARAKLAALLGNPDTQGTNTTAMKVGHKIDAAATAASDGTSNVVDDGGVSSEENSGVDMTLVREFQRRFCSSGLCVDMLVHGNMGVESARRLGAAVVQIIGSKNLGTQYLPRCLVTKIQRGSRLGLLVRPPNLNETNVAVEYYLQVGPYNVADAVLCQLLDQVISEPFYDELRTKQQLGYEVSTEELNSWGILGFRFKVVSSSTETAGIIAAIMTFLRGLGPRILAIKEDIFCNHITSLATNLLQLPMSLTEAARNAWYHIDDQDCDFTQHVHKARALKAMLKDWKASRAALAAFASKICAESHDSARRLIVCAVPTNVTLGKVPESDTGFRYPRQLHSLSQYPCQALSNIKEKIAAL